MPKVNRNLSSEQKKTMRVDYMRLDNLDVEELIDALLIDILSGPRPSRDDEEEINVACWEDWSDYIKESAERIHFKRKLLQK